MTQAGSDLTTTWVAIYGAILATFTLAWNIIREFRDRPKLKVDVMFGEIIPSETAEENVVALIVTNVGKYPVMVTMWAGAFGHYGKKGFFINSHQLPKMLQPTEYLTLFSNRLEDFGPNIKRMWICDSSGKRWATSRTRLKQAMKDLHEFKQGKK